MRPDQTVVRPGRIARVARTAENGIAMALTAMLLVPLMLFAAFSVDVGSWYLEASRTQRAADAAALAGVVWMPDLAAAETTALDAAARNGYVHGVNATVQVSTSGDSRLRVDITTESPSFFGAIVTDGIDIDRWAIAEFIDPIPLGNPTSALGAADLTFAGSQNLWLNAHSWCSTRGNGDLLNTAQKTGSACTALDNPNYREEGYIYVIDKPAGIAVNVDVLNGGLCDRPGWPWWLGEHNLTNGPEIEFRLYAPDELQPHTDNINPILQLGGVESSTQSGCGDWTQWNIDEDTGWDTYFTIPSSAPAGRYLLSAAVTEESTATGNNIYGLRVDDPATAGSFCSTLVASNCPSLHALDFLSIHLSEATPSPTDGAGQAAEFFFAEVNEDFAGKIVEIRLWDPAEGSEYLQFLDPSGSPVDFTWSTVDCAELPSTCDGRSDLPTQVITSCPYTGTGACLDTGNNNFHNRMLLLRIDLPADYSCNAGNCWWKIRYAPKGNGTVNDTTTWSIRALGDPLRIVE